MKIGIGGIYHETHTFATFNTGRKDFDRNYFKGENIISSFKDTKTSLGGFIDSCLKNGDQIVPTLYAAATPSGKITRKAFESIVNDFLVQLDSNMDMDAFLLAQHGAMVVQDYPDAEGYLISLIKKKISGKPVVVTVDYHANLTRKMVSEANCIVGYDTYPHVDVYDRAVDSFKVLKEISRKNVSVKNAFLQLPVLGVPQAITTERGIMKKAVEMAHDFEKEKDIINITICGGYVYSDSESTGISIIVSSKGELEAAKNMATEIAGHIWANKKNFTIKNTKVEKAIDMALRSKKFPVILVDVADNIGGGSPGDGTVLLREIINKNMSRSVVFIADKKSVGKCITKGIGKKIELEVGGKTDNLHGSPVNITGYIKMVDDGDFINIGKNMTGIKTRMGKSVLLLVNNIKLILTEFPTPPNDPGMLLNMGIDLSREKYLVVKGAIAWKTGINLKPGKIIYVDTPGLCSANLNFFDYKNIRRPIYPFDDFDIDLNDLVKIYKQ